LPSSNAIANMRGYIYVMLQYLAKNTSGARFLSPVWREEGSLGEKPRGAPIIYFVGDLPGVRIMHNFGVSVVAAVLGLQRREHDGRERRKVSSQAVVVVTAVARG
jgi:hypothetical protein